MPSFFDPGARAEERGPAADFAPHPLFGRMPGSEWGALMHRHVDHHPRQCGV